ncbi:hypothetical protein [Pseudobdellovibrio sp. HCB154]|uniref:hypothetical protein n=1 Tax=Pseudobdellovibrio sp. HCB154 TaxID=3386277 RepID=UPI0039172E65
MKKATLLSSLLAMAVILSTGCTKSQIHNDLDKTMADIDKKLEQTRLENDQLVANTLGMLTAGGQPGTITLNGVVSTDADKLDSRITVSQQAGLNQSGSATAMAKNVLVVNSLKTEELDKLKTDIKTLEDKRTYINLGCELAESEIAGLTETSAITSPTVIMKKAEASRVFICGDVNMTKEVILEISASDIMLKDASISSLNKIGSITLKSKTLVLIGKNKIATLGENSSGLVLSAPAIDLTVTNEIYGDGTLALESKGGNNVAEKKDSK